MMLRKSLFLCIAVIMIVSCVGKASNETYLWYPGQLASYMQQNQRAKSKERCTFVGYPGKFFQPAGVTKFRARIPESKAKSLTWNASGDVMSEYEDGYIILTVDTRGTKLPAILISGPGSWETSLDGVNWTMPETDARFNNPEVFPDTDQEQTVQILPASQSGLESGGILVDFKEIEVGSVSMSVTGTGILDFYVGESVAEAMSGNEVRHEQAPIPTVEVDGTQVISLPERALRYIRIEKSPEIIVSDIVFNAAIWPVNQMMTFECSDPQLNAMFEAGIKTLHTSMHNFYLDGVKRDYLPWAMDAILGSLGGDYAFGDRQVTRNGISVALMPPSPAISDWGIPDYPLHALIGLKHEYLRYGDLTSVEMFKDRILSQLDLYESVQTEDGFLVSNRSTSGFTPGWACKNGPEKHGIAAYAQMMLYENFRIAAYFADLLGDTARNVHYSEKTEELRESIIAHFWDEDQLAFINGYLADGSKDTRISDHAQYWSVICDLYPEEHYDELFTKVLPSIPYYMDDISYDRGYECLAYYKGGHMKEFFSLLDDIWGDWLRQGHTRFPENFSPNASASDQLVFYRRPYGLSLCHAANGTPPVLAVLYGLFGFSQDEDHPSHYSLSPNLMGLDWFKGTFPVKEGMVSIEMSTDGGLKVVTPKKCSFSINE